MDIKEFVAESLRQVSEAIEANDSTFTKENLTHLDGLKSFNMFGVGTNIISYVDFDIAVSESSSKEGGAKLSIAGVGGIGGDLKNGAETISRIKFRVPIKIPKKSDA